MRSTTFVITVACMLALGCGNNSYPPANTNGGAPSGNAGGGNGGGTAGGGAGGGGGNRDGGIITDGGLGGGNDAGFGDGGTFVDGGIAASPGLLFIETNESSGNAIVAFSRAPDGRLTMVQNSKVETGGKGLAPELTQRRGPFESDQNLLLTPDRRFVLAVNTGSDSISVMRVDAQGFLTPVAGQPFYSGGHNPVSLGISGDHVFVVNKAIDGTTQPSYAVLELRSDGRLTLLPNKDQRLAMGASPSIAYVAPSGMQLFGTRFYDQSRADQTRPEQIDAYTIDLEGTITHATNSPYVVPAQKLVPPLGLPPPLALNLVAHPSQSLLYVGFVTLGRIGVYSYDSQASLTLVEEAPSTGHWPAFFRIDRDGKYLYASNNQSGSVTTWDLTNPRRPVEKSILALRNSMAGPAFTDASGVKQTFTSEPFQLALDESGQHLYVLSQRVTNKPTDLKGNYLHVLDVGVAGLLDEKNEPIDLSAIGIDPRARPQGVLLVSTNATK